MALHIRVLDIVGVPHGFLLPSLPTTGARAAVKGGWLAAADCATSMANSAPSVANYSLSVANYTTSVAVKGGRLAAAAYPARVVALILSDVVGDPLDVIASGSPSS